MARDLRALFAEPTSVATATSEAALGDVIAGVATALKIAPSDSLLVVGPVHGNEECVLSDNHIREILKTSADRILLHRIDLDSVSRLRSARGAVSSPMISVARSLSAALERAIHLGRALAAGELTLRPDELFRSALANRVSPLLGWSNLAKSAIGALRSARAQQDSSDADTEFELEFARDVALRHTGETAVMPWPPQERLRRYERAVRLAVLAHIVQSAADGDDERARDYATRAILWLAPPGERHPEDAKLLGAVGRAWAAAGAGEEALTALRDALDTWMALRAAHGASYAIAEYLRLAAVTAPERARVALAKYVPLVLADPELDETSVAFVLLAVGRANVLLGDADAGLAALGDVATAWNAAPIHAQQARLRWKARAHQLANDREASDDARRVLAAHGPSENLHLASLDVASDDDERLAALEALCSLPDRGVEARRLLGQLAPGWNLENIAACPDVLSGVRNMYRY